jgi:hypothetical protein
MLMELQFVGVVCQEEESLEGHLAQSSYMLLSKVAVITNSLTF